MARAIALIVMATLAFPSAGWAQDSQAQQVDVSKMGVSLDRIRRQLAAAPPDEVRADGLKLDVRVNVFGQAPPLDLVPNDFSLTYGPVPHTAPTHQEHIDFVTPKEYSSPPVPIFGLAVWAAQKLADRSRKQRCEEELAAYRELVMQGVAVAAPRCSQ